MKNFDLLFYFSYYIYCELYRILKYQSVFFSDMWICIFHNGHIVKYSSHFEKSKNEIVFYFT